MKLRRFFWQSLTAFSILIICCFISLFVSFQFFNSIGYAILASGIVATGVGLYLAFRISRPLENLLDQVRQVESGQVHEVVDLSRNETKEIHQIATLMDGIASQLNSRIDLIRKQKNEQEAIVQSLDEGLIAINSSRYITHVNPAAIKIFREYRTLETGIKIEEAIRHPELQALIELTMQEKTPIERDIEFIGETVRYLRVHTSPLLEQLNKEFAGVVLVINDVTRLRQLEGMRKNFVANVSHELRTPLTSIQGFAETLMNPSVNDPKEIRKFIEIIQRHATRLGRIIEDILALSRIERDSENQQIDKKPESIDEILNSVVELCGVKASKKDMKLRVEKEEDFKVPCDRYLIEQALVNLVDNAVRYSDSGQEILIQAKRDDKYIKISVKDKGAGMAQSQLPKIFERFYRVDRARSRELGGTGLGLSIVKHIALAHLGKVTAESEIGKGSTFHLFLPAE